MTGAFGLGYLPTITVSLETPSTAGSAGGYLVFGDATYGKFGTGKFAGPTGYMVDRASYCRGFEIRRGSTDQNDVLFHAQTGTASVALDNRTRLFDPVSNTDIRPMRSIAMTATYSAVTYNLFTGFVQQWPVEYPATAKDSVVTAQCVDGAVQLVGLELTDILGEHLTSTRVSKLLDLTEWPVSLRTINTGLTVMPQSTKTVSGWAAMVEAADSEFGELYVDADGTMVFRSRTNIIADSRSSTSQATFGDAGGAELPYADVTFSQDTDQIRNDISVVYNEAGDVARAADAQSVIRYGRKNYTLQTQIKSGSVAQNMANYILGLYKDPQVRVTSLVLKPAKDPSTLWPQALGRLLGDRVTVKLTPPGGGSRITRVGLIRGITHSLSQAGEWVTTFALQDVSNYGTYITFGTTTFNDTSQFWF